MIEIEEGYKDQLDKQAKECAIMTETYCIDCRDELEPLGLLSGVNTPANKLINNITDNILEQEELDESCSVEIRDMLIDYFYRQFDDNIEDKEVETHVECVYCFEQKRGSDHIPILVTNDNGIMTQTRQDWR